MRMTAPAAAVPDEIGHVFCVCVWQGAGRRRGGGAGWLCSRSWMPASSISIIISSSSSINSDNFGLGDGASNSINQLADDVQGSGFSSSSSSKNAVGSRSSEQAFGSSHQSIDARLLISHTHFLGISRSYFISSSCSGGGGSSRILPLVFVIHHILNGSHRLFLQQPGPGCRCRCCRRNCNTCSVQRLVQPPVLGLSRRIRCLILPLHERAHAARCLRNYNEMCAVKLWLRRGPGAAGGSQQLPSPLPGVRCEPCGVWCARRRS